MRALWVDAGREPDLNRARTQRMTALYFPITDPLEDLGRRIDASKAAGYNTGVYMAANWPEFEGLDGHSMAERMHQHVSQLRRKVKTQFDIELHDPDLVADCLSQYRAMNPQADVSWTMEGHQAGWMIPIVDRVLKARVRFAPQAYTGSMVGTDPLAVARDLTRIGIPDSLISPFYDAATLPLYWDGFAFSQARLP